MYPSQLPCIRRWPTANTVMMKGCLGQLSTLTVQYNALQYSTVLYVGCQAPDKTDDDFVARHYINKRRPVNSHPPNLYGLLASNHQRPDDLLASSHVVLYST
jgi:hypothetical protein